MVIENYVWIASRAIILPSVTIGRGAVVASNAMVPKDVEPCAIVAGIPTKKSGSEPPTLNTPISIFPSSNNKRWWAGGSALNVRSATVPSI